MSGYYQLRLPSLIYGGEDALKGLKEILDGANAKKAALFTDRAIRGAGLLEGVTQTLREVGLDYEIIDGLAAEPTVYQVDEYVEQFKQIQADFIIAVGGGSVMDVAKLASVLLTEDYTVFDLLERPQLARKQVPTVMIPTTAGTGSEATPNSIVTVPEKALKVGIVNPAMIGDYVILDAEMIRNLPRPVAASTGVDALAHAIECYTSNKATLLSDVFALEALRLIFPNILPACNERENMPAKRAMITAAFLAGAAITAAGTTAVHALSYPLGGKYHIAHGVSNAMLLTPVMRFNAPACQDRLATVYDVVMGPRDLPADEKARLVVDRLVEIVKALDIPDNLAAYGIGRDDLDGLVEAGMQVTRLLNNNMRQVCAEDARQIYLQIMP